MKVMDFNGRHNITGRKIRELRISRKMTQDQLAARMQIAGIQVNQKAISRIESGDRIVSDFELLHLAHALNVPVDALFDTEKQTD